MMKGKRGIKLWAVLAWLLIWQLAAMAMGMEIFFVSPVAVLVRLFQLVQTLDFWAAVVYSLLRIAGGFLLAVVLGCVLAAAASRLRRLREFLAPIMLTIRSVPVVSFIILALICFSSKNLAVLISFLMVLPIIYTNVQAGISATDKGLLEMAKVFRLSGWRTIRYIYIPQVLPHFRSACTVGVGLAWKSGIAAEVIGIPNGSIGEALQQAKLYLDTPDLFAWTVTIVVLSLLFEKVFLWLLGKVFDRLERV